MEVQTLKSLKGHMEQCIINANEALKKKNSANNAITMLHADKEFNQQQERAAFYMKKMVDHGGGTIVKINGQVWGDEVFARSKIRVKKNFQLLLNCSTIEDAKDIFEAQVLNTMDFVRDSITYRTIALKHITFI